MMQLLEGAACWDTRRLIICIILAISFSHWQLLGRAVVSFEIFDDAAFALEAKEGVIGFILDILITNIDINN
jgi:hypothetical protein